MNIQILDSWLREHLRTEATAQQIAEHLSLSSVSIERVEKHGNDYLYDIEVTTNRPDLASVVGLAREAAAVLPHAGIAATFLPLKTGKPPGTKPTEHMLQIKNDPKLVNRICAVVMEVLVKDSPNIIKGRLEAAGIRSLNNLIDITNYVMREVGHPAHVFDFDRLNTSQLSIREARKEEEITTLDKKSHILTGGEIVAVDDSDRIVDLLGIMGLENSVVTDTTRRILLFIDNNNSHHIRQASMTHAIRTDAAQLNEKGLDPELAMDALLFGISLYKAHADGIVVSEIIDIYPNKPKQKTITITEKKIQHTIGVQITLHQAATILKSLDFTVESTADKLTVQAPSFRANDIAIPEDLIEEIARVYGYNTIPSELPPLADLSGKQDLSFFWEDRIKQALKYWGFSETYTYSMVSEQRFDGPTDTAVKLVNPLTEDFVYMRNSLLLSVLQIVNENSNHERLKLFEIANVYQSSGSGLPREERRVAFVIKHPRITFFEAKGVIEQLAKDLGIESIRFNQKESFETMVTLGNEQLGTITVLDENLVAAEMNMSVLIKHATTKKIYKPISKYPPIIEDISITVSEDVLTGTIIETIKKQSALVTAVSLLDRYRNKRTFHVLYQDRTKNLTGQDVAKIREKIVTALEKTYKAKVV